MSSSTVAATTLAIRHIRRLSSSSTDHNDWFPFQNAAEFNMNIAVALIFLVCFVVGALALNAIIRCVYNNHHESSSTSSSYSSSAEQKLAQMSLGPTLNFSNGLKLVGADHAECTICLSEFVDGEGIRVLPKCNHGFHVNCIESWLISRTSCPTCRSSCLKTSPEKIPDGEQPQQQQNDNLDVEACVNPSERQMIVVQQQRSDIVV